jgi:hypothetical protein
MAPRGFVLWPNECAAVPATGRRGVQRHDGLARGKRFAMPRTARPTRIESGWRIRWLDHTGNDSPPSSRATRARPTTSFRRRQGEVEDALGHERRRPLQAPEDPRAQTVQMTMCYAHLAPAAFREDWAGSGLGRRTRTLGSCRCRRGSCNAAGGVAGRCRRRRRSLERRRIRSGSPSSRRNV